MLTLKLSSIYGYAVSLARSSTMLLIVGEITRIKTNNCRFKPGMCKDLLTIYTYILTSRVHTLSIV